ncbi:hypothetical protein [Methylorubrum thiocyanatum]
MAEILFCRIVTAFLRPFKNLRSHIAGQIHIAKTEEGEKRSKKLYAGLEPYAYLAKIYAQIITGFLIALLLVIKFFIPISKCPSQDLLGILYCKNTLALVGDGLMYSAGFELAYMLFTPGPDEAIEPVILGMAATILIVISDDKTNYFDALIPLSLVLSIWILFYLSKKFLPDQIRTKRL